MENPLLPKIALLLTCILIQVSFSFSQDKSQNQKDTKIGLVLSGGGAKGMAHVGVIRAMEKAGLKADYVVGTSMGSVVGGLYALGYNSDELEQIIKSIDWDLLLSNRVSFESISFEEKEYYNRYLLEFPVVDGEVSFPSGLIEGQTLSDVLHYYTWPAISYKNFDEFPIPFRCVATDISTGEPIIFDSGYLHNALRSSIAIPTVFSAFELDSTSVVDGGVVNNFPVDVVRGMGADFVIGVNVSDEDFVSAKDLGGFAAILMQLAMAESLRKTKDNIESTDIYIKPDLGIYSTGSFSSYEEILKLGDKTGSEYYPLFQQLADSLGRNDKSPGIGLNSNKVSINKIEILGNRIISKDLILSKLNISSGKAVSRDELEYAMNMVFGINAFSKVDYSVKELAEGGFDLVVRVKEKPATLLNTSLHYDNQFSAGLIFNLTKRDWIGKSSRTVFVLNVSENPKFRFDYYKYIGKEKKFAINPRLNLLRQELPQYQNGEVEEIIIERDNNIAVNFISTSSLKQSFLFGPIYESSRSRGKVTVSVPENLKSAYQRSLGFRFRYYRNSQNDRNFPTRGAESIIEPKLNLKNWVGVNIQDGVDTVFFDIEGFPLGIPSDILDDFIKTLAPDAHLNLYTKYTKYFPLSKAIQLKPEFSAGVTFGTAGEERIYNEFFIGGYQNIRFTDTRFWGLNYAEVTAANFLKMGLDIQVVPLKKIFLRGGMNWLGFSDYVPLDDSDLRSKIFQDEQYFGYGVDLSYQSLIGPITIGVTSNSKDNQIRGYFSLGFSFGYSDR
ncbi:MAG: patatin-like phospholipase family protein [Algoriphagus sp.]|uniref:patatin-like phospholipase family protein n=1 Tax=Algoriphagus sp. TaxID=1872435 RepID=UPI00262A1B97|nr:patatin-like phospholipase family protein [Algoriphagus sp.]MDG1277622.1 patatin-like phospholipase family protein [Algoriphagus sp.]